MYGILAEKLIIYTVINKIIKKISYSAYEYLM